MEPVSIIVTALIEGLKFVATSSVKDAYNGLKALVQRKLADKAKVKAAVENVEEEPENKVYHDLLSHELEKAGAGKDEELVSQAKALLELLKKEGLISEAKFNAVLIGDGAIAQGPGAVAGGKGAIVGGRDVHVNIQSPGRKSSDK